MKQEKVLFKNSKGEKLVADLFVPEGEGPFPVVVVCHGLSSDKKSTNTTMTVPGLIEAGIAAFALDFWGHGESAGKLEDVTVSEAIDDLRNALKWVEENPLFDNRRIGILGSSFGGITTIMVATEKPQIKAIVLKAPVCDIQYQTGKRMDVSKWEKDGFIPYESSLLGPVRLGYSLYKDGIKYKALDVAKKIRIPTMVVIGDKDVTVFSDKVKEFYDALDCMKEIVWIKDGAHRFTEEQKKELFPKAVEWFKRWLLG